MEQVCRSIPLVVRPSADSSMISLLIVLLISSSSTNHRQRCACCACGGGDGDGASFLRGGVCLRFWGRRRRRPSRLRRGRLRCGASDNWDRRVFLCATLGRVGDDDGSCCSAFAARDRVNCPRLGGKICSVRHRQHLLLHPPNWTSRKWRLFGSRWMLRGADSVYHYECFCFKREKK